MKTVSARSCIAMLYGAAASLLLVSAGASGTLFERNIAFLEDAAARMSGLAIDMEHLLDRRGGTATRAPDAAAALRLRASGAILPFPY